MMVFLRIVILAAALLASGCNPDTWNPTPVAGDPTDVKTVPPDTFATVLDLEDNFQQSSHVFLQSETIHFVLSVTNLSAQVQELVFRDAQTFDFIVVDADENIVWQWSQDRGFITVITELAWQPGETKTTRVAWEQAIGNGEWLSPGEYHVQAVVTLAGIDPDDIHNESQFRSELIPLEIQ